MPGPKTSPPLGPLILFLLVCAAAGAAAIGSVASENIESPKSTTLYVSPNNKSVFNSRGGSPFAPDVQVQIVCYLGLIPVAFVVPFCFTRCAQPLRSMIRCGCWTAAAAGLFAVFLSQLAPVLGGRVFAGPPFSDVRLVLLPIHVILFFLAGLAAGSVRGALVPGTERRPVSGKRPVPRPTEKPLYSQRPLGCTT